MGAIEQILNEHDHRISPVRETPFAGPIVWQRDTLTPEDGLMKLDAACRKELDELIEILRHNPLATPLLEVEDFDLPACRAMMKRARATLEHGVGFVIIDKLPMDDYSVDEARAVYWLLSQMLSRPVAQS